VGADDPLPPDGQPEPEPCAPEAREYTQARAVRELRDAESRLLAELKRIREHLDVVNDELKAVAAASPPQQGAAVAGLAKALNTVEWDFPGRLRALVDAEPSLAERYSGPTERLQIEVGRADEEFDAGTTGSSPDPVAAAAVAQPHVAAALRQVHLIVLPSMLRDCLEQRPVAGAIALGGIFPGDVDDAAAVRLLSQRPEAFPGVIDSERGIAYRTADTTAQKLAYLLAPLLAFACGAIFFWILGHLDEWTSIDIDQLNSTRHLLGVYVLVTFGSLVHLVVSVRKRRQASGEGAVIVPAEVLDWAHVRAMNACWLLVPVIVATLVVRLTDLRVEGTEDWAIAILAGYSADSVAQLGFDRLNQAVEVFAAKTRGSSA